MLIELKDEELQLKIDDLYLCGYLASKGFKPRGLETTGFGRKHFVYPEDVKLEIDGLMKKFYSGEVEVSLPTLRSYVKSFKELMHNA